jgi:hypothetical protein
MTIQDRANVRLWLPHAINVARHSVAEIASHSGASSHFLDDPLQRAHRDINTLAGHIVFDYDRAAELYGKVALGMDLGPAPFL